MANSVGAVERTNKEMNQMGYSGGIKPKSMKSVSVRKPMARKPKMRNFSRSK